jgi:hypothetical protein
MINNNKKRQINIIEIPNKKTKNDNVQPMEIDIKKVSND